MKNTSSKHVIIIGAGIAGLAAAECLSRSGISYTLYERGPTACSALHRIDPKSVLLSPMACSKLPGMKINVNGNTHVSFGEYLNILQQYQREKKIHVTIHSDVVSVQQNEKTFLVLIRDSNGLISESEGTHIINATGILSCRVLPDRFDPATSGLTWKHSVDVRPSDLTGVRKLLVLGGGNSASEILVQWLQTRSADDRARISVKRRLVSVPNSILGLDIHYLIWLPEHLPVFGFRDRLLDVREPILGRQLHRALMNGVISREPVVRSFEKDSVIFDNDHSMNPDFMVFATGFRYNTSHLGALVLRDKRGYPLVSGCQSTQTTRVYLLGVRFGRTFASHYIRGISRDAQFVTNQILQETDFA